MKIIITTNYSFEWDEAKDKINQQKHGVSFEEAQKVFEDTYRLIWKDRAHSSQTETRYFCVGKVKREICTVRFTVRGKIIRIFGAGYWRREKRIYEEKIKNR
jgi:uncharacterized DUF497 family protein